MATQWITVVKVSGVTGEYVLSNIRRWQATRLCDDSPECSPEQWPKSVQAEVDRLVEKIDEHATELYIAYYAKWLDTSSMGDSFQEWFLPTNSTDGLIVHSTRYELYGCALPDQNSLLKHFEKRRRDEADQDLWLRWHLKQAIESWSDLVPSAALVVIREVVGGTVTIDEISASLQQEANWNI